MRYKTFRSLTPAFVLAAVLCLTGMPASAAPQGEGASPAIESVEIGWLSGLSQWIGQIWSGGGLLGQSQVSAAPTADVSHDGVGEPESLQASGRDYGPALDPNGRR